MEASINWLAVIIAGASSFLVGGIWYSALFAKSWQRLVGLSDKQIASGMAKVFIGSFILSLIMAANLAYFIGSNDASFGAFAGFAAGFGWVAMALGVNYLFERKSLQLFFINAGYNIVTFTLMGWIIGVM